MGYYILVEKDSKLMQKCWKWIVIVVLILIVATCFATSYAFQALLENFNFNCVSSAIVAYKRIPIYDGGNWNGTQDKKEANFYEQKINATYKEFKSYYTLRDIGARPIDETDAVPKTQIFQFLNKGPSVYRTTTERANASVAPASAFHTSDGEFFKNYQIDEMNTKWGDPETCSYFYYFPTIEIIFAVVWIVFILISGRRGERTAKTFIHKSWRLVVPATICFGALAICSAVYAGILNSRLNSFCTEFRQRFNNTDLPCKLLINRFSKFDDTAFEPATNFNLSKYIPYITIFLWLLVGFVMLLRCILGADFEIEEVEHYTEQTGAAFDPNSNNPNSKVKFIDDGVRRYSKARVYRPTTQTNIHD